MGKVPNSFMANVLAQIRAPQTAVNIQNLQTWQRYEGGTATWNPLDCVVAHPGSVDYNPQGVQDYPNAAEGEMATAQTLTNGRYTAILVKLRASATLPEWNDSSVLEQIDTWGTTDFAAYIRTLTPPEEEDLTPAQAQQLQDIFDAIFSATPPDGSAAWNNIEIIRRQATQLGATYDLQPGPIPTKETPP